MVHTKKIIILFMLAAVVPFLGIPYVWRNPLMGLLLLIGVVLFAYDLLFEQKRQKVEQSDHRGAQEKESGSKRVKVGQTISNTGANHGNSLTGEIPSSQSNDESLDRRHALSSDGWRQKTSRQSGESPWGSDGE